LHSFNLGPTSPETREGCRSKSANLPGDMSWGHFLRETLFCNTERDREPYRKGEIIHSHGSPIMSPSDLDDVSQFNVGAVRYDEREHRRARSPMPTSFNQMGQRDRERNQPGSPRMSFSDALAEHLATTAAAADCSMPGRGLYVPMQRGLVLSSPVSESSANRPPGTDGRSRTNHSRDMGDAYLQGAESYISGASFLTQKRSRAPSQVVVALGYEADPDDPVDLSLERHLKQLPTASAAALLLQRMCPGEYEVNSMRVDMGWRFDGGSSPEVYVSPAGETVPAEPLAAYLRRVAEGTLAINNGVQLLGVMQPSLGLGQPGAMRPPPPPAGPQHQSFVASRGVTPQRRPAPQLLPPRSTAPQAGLQRPVMGPSGTSFVAARG